jgi:hypothetical protein
MIIAIDEDRAQSCSGSLKAAGRSEPQPTLNPVLDQLFEVMGAYGREAVGLLLTTMHDPQPLVRSQAAYLLLDWVGNVDISAQGHDKETLEKIPAQMSGRDRNLHFRFHQVEILETLIDRFPHRSDAPNEAVMRLKEIAKADVDVATVDDVKDVYAECQELVSLRAELLTQGPSANDYHQRLGTSVRRCMKLIDGDSRFQEFSTGAAVEARLECWEVTLGLAVYMCGRLHRNAEFTSFVEAALKHPFWVVRWWAFAGSIGIVRAASDVEDRVLAARCARRAAERLATGVEPMGLKHRQCALARRLLADDNSAASEAMQVALSRVADEHLSAASRQALAEGYYEAMAASPDAYLFEFFRRLGEIVPHLDPN